MDFLFEEVEINVYGKFVIIYLKIGNFRARGGMSYSTSGNSTLSFH